MFSFKSSLWWNRVQRYVCTSATVFVMAYAGNVHAQSFEINWPEDVLEGSCDQSVDEVAESPEVVVDGACMDVGLTFTDEVLVPLCAQEAWVDRHWMAAGCGDTLMHVQRIRLRDGTAPVVVFDETYTGHFCAGTLEWLPNVQDNCDVNLVGGFSTSDTLELCDGVFSFEVALNLADDCGNVLDTNYTVVLHEACDDIVYPVVAGCTDSTATNFEMIATCDNGTCAYASEFCGEGTYFEPNSGVCLPLSDCANPSEYCGLFTIWDDELERCVPEVISGACYFDVNNTGVVDVGDLFGFLGVYGTSCASIGE